MSSELKQAGQIDIRDISLISYNKLLLDLRPYLVNLQIRESISDTFIQATLTLADSLNITRHVPVVGNEQVLIRFSTPTRQEISFMFNVGRISRKIGADKSYIYNFDLISSNMFLDLQTKMSKSYFDSIENVVADICQTYYNKSFKFNMWNTNVKKNLVIPYCHPYEAISQLCDKSYDYLGNTNFVFFEGIDGSYNYRPFFNTLDIPKRKYSQFNPNAPGTFLADPEIEYSRIREMEIYETHDSVKNLSQGVFSSAAIFTDSFEKSYKVSKFSYNEDFYNQYHINTYGIIPTLNESLTKKYSSHKKVVPNTSYQYDDIKSYERLQDFVQRRQSGINSADSYKLAIKTFGDSNVRLGSNIEVQIQTNAPVNLISEERDDPYLSGTYCISRIHHNITTTSYDTDLIVVKDSSRARYPDEKTAS